MPPRPCRAVLALTAAAALHLAPSASAAPATGSADKPDPKASKAASKPDSKASKSDKSSASKSDPKASKTDKSGATKPDPKASKPDARASAVKPDPKAIKPGTTKPDPKASKPDPKPDKSGAAKPDPKASKPDPKADKSGATKPDPKASKPDPKASPAPAPQPAPPASPPAPPSVGDGYWLGARLLGPADAQAAATRALAADLASEPGAAGTVGRAASLPEAVQWVARWAFTGPPLPVPTREPVDAPLHTGDVPRPGGALWTDHRVVLHALTITGRSSDGGTREIRWPQTAAEIVAPGLAWVPAVLLAERAPLFAMPAAHVPPAGERHALVRRSGSLFILGYADRCTQATGERVCLRWAQVVARDGDSFRSGYLPAFQVARVDGWIRGAGQNPRAQLLAAGTVGARAQFVLIARARDGNLHRRTVLAPMTGDAYPAARLRVDGEWATIDFTGSPAQRIALDPGMDARVR